ncbi:FadR/GntR family transcriptional regulator [Pelosinus propionicus]|uniref:Regulatory protein, gntR family n=1 Tax=Pelosinus propionicus DSM 13327 TaxID=1123291 RepID=A0A1I4LH46_9FIRM|nr:FadR/GntR family transcriptional regulator [Pelosinus propionicus]SFL89927.1 regulatory protein, gntR family [Pelosinus propionicus DSM 13327]
MKNFFVETPLKKYVEDSSDALYMQIVSRIQQLMREGHLKEGDKLPSERELAEIFNVSRVPVREALKVLEFLGAIQHIRGEGVFVKKIEMKRILHTIDFFMTDPADQLINLFEAREAFEIQAVRLAAERRTEADIEEMQQVLLEMEFLISVGKPVSDVSTKFHTAVIAAAHNDVIIQVNEFLSDLLSYSRQKSLSDATRHAVSLQYHQLILHHIIERNPQAAVCVMQEHLNNAKIAIEKMIHSE